MSEAGRRIPWVEQCREGYIVHTAEGVIGPFLAFQLAQSVRKEAELHEALLEKGGIEAAAASTTSKSLPSP
jgi:hypothetical protein